MYRLNDSELLRYIEEDVPYLDLTTHLQDIENKKARLKIITREELLVSCMEEACRIVELLNCKVDSFIPSKQNAGKGDVLLTFSGDYNDVHKAWRSAQVLLEYSCKMSTYTHSMKKEIESANKHCELLTTRKTFPLAKKFCIKSIMSGGAMPHRLNLGETIVFFNNHRIVYNTNQEFYENIQKFKIKVPEKKIVVESDNFEDAVQLMKYGVDVLQLDKVEIELLKTIVKYKEENYPNVKILASGGIDINNAAEFASTGIDGIVTSKPYICGMANIGTKMELIA
ncbi:ModD protein [Sulfurimonas sp.]|uniref:ModD protein n=1 Tax=Sulfurimonas sp. TaxID=2022749 RepID=UPI003564045E